MLNQRLPAGRFVWLIAALISCVFISSATDLVAAQPSRFNGVTLLIDRDEPGGILSRKPPMTNDNCEMRDRKFFICQFKSFIFSRQRQFAEQQVAHTDPAPDQPAPRTDANSQIAHTQLLEKARNGRIDIYFEGDSITRRWGTSDDQYKAFLENWRQNFFGWNAANFGWGGDTTQNILWRLHNGELDNVNPKIIVLMAGTNNVGRSSPQGSLTSQKDPRVAAITSGIKAILDLCRQKAPHAVIVLMGITPRNDNMQVMPIINQINDNIAKFANGKMIRYLNINHKLADKDGKLFAGMANADGLHLDVKGYQVWANALKPIFTKLLGPPRKEDHAPPPTGDPSAAKTLRGD